MEVWLVTSLPLHCPPSLFQRSSFKLRSSSSSSSSRITTLLIPSARKEQVAIARDVRIDFGRYKGKMLGSLPSTYLKWVSTNLRAQDYQHWANLADQVLVYRDRIEWESAHNLLNGNNVLSSSSSSSDGGKLASELLADISERFGWDNDDKLGWTRIDFSLLGTSKGGRIPRTTPPRRTSVSLNAPSNTMEEKEEEVLVIKKQTVTGISNEYAGANNGVDSWTNNRRSDRRERLRMKRSSESGQKEKTRTGLAGFGFRGVDEEEEDSTGHGQVMIKDNHPSITTTFPVRDMLLLLNKRLSSTRRNIRQSHHPDK